MYQFKNWIKKRIGFIILIYKMPKTQVESSRKRAKNIKNIYILKINSLFKMMGDQSSELSCL